MVDMHLEELPTRSQDYLKVLWDLSEHSGGTPVALKDVAGRLEQKVPTASEAIKKLAAQGLVEHERYQGVSLSPAGRELAMQMVRRHRLIETFLVRTLGYRWDQVHDEAEALEHAVSDFMVERMAAVLGHPERDPHGDPIPAADGRIVHGLAGRQAQRPPGPAGDGRLDHQAFGSELAEGGVHPSLRRLLDPDRRRDGHAPPG